MTTRDSLMRSAIAALLLVGLVAAGCAGEPAPEPAVTEPEPAPEPIALDRLALADETRPADELEQDADRHAIDVYEFLGVQPGMTVADVWPGAGYNTHLLSRVIEDGKVYAVMGFYAEGQFATLEGLTARVADAALDNVEIVNTIPEVPAGTLDVAIAVRNYHDAEQFGEGRQATVGQLFEIVKPGGIVGIVEVATPHEGWHEDTHRLNENTVIEEFTAGGFELVERSDMLANPDDDHSTSGFEQGRHTVDRYLLKFRKPEAGGDS